MKKTTVAAFVLASLFFISCEKEYICDCGNPGGIYKTFTIRGTKKNASDKCHDHAQDVPFSETYCNMR